MKPILLSFYFPRSIEVEGAAALFDSLARVLVDRGFEVTLHAPLRSRADQPYRVRDYHSSAKRSFPGYLSDLRKTARSFPTVLTMLSSPASFSWIRRSLDTHPHAVYYFGSPLQTGREIFRPPFSYQYLKHWVAKNIVWARFGKPSDERFIVGTRYQREQLLRLGFPPESVKRIPLSLSRKRIVRLSKPSLRQEFSLPSGPLLGYLGHYSPIKGVPVLLRAFEQVASRTTEPHLALAWSGKGSQSGTVHRMLENPRFAGRVHQLGMVESSRFLAAVDLVVLPFVHSSFPHPPLVLLEAFAAGTPVLTSDLAGLSEFVVPGKTGWLVPPADAAKMADTIVQVFESPEALDEMGKGARKWIEEEGSIEAHLDTLLEML